MENGLYVWDRYPCKDANEQLPFQCLFYRRFANARFQVLWLATQDDRVGCLHRTGVVTLDDDDWR